MNPPLFAVDTNFLMDLAHPRDAAHDALDLISERFPKASVLATDSVLDELDHFVSTPSSGKQALALKAQAVMIARGIQPALLNELQASTAEGIAGKLLDHGIILWKEQHDALILAEAAVFGCQLLISSDEHLRGADPAQLARVLSKYRVPMVVIRKPVEIVREFGGW